MTENSKTTTPIVPRTDPISISQESNGTIRVQATNAPTLSTSWVPSWIKWTWSWSWKPTSAELLLKSEAGMLKHSGLQFEQTLVKAGNHEINTIKIGQGPPLVMLHGFGAGLGFWVCNLKELSEHHTVYAVDLPGFGRSSRNPFKGNTAEEAEEYFLTSLESWRKHMQLDQFTLLGHSFGGYLAGCYTLRHPQNVQHLILADPWGIPQRPPEVVNNNIPLRWRIVRRVATMFNPLTIIRAAGPYGPGLISKFRKDIEQKFQHVYPDTSVVSQYIYHLNAQSPAGEVAFALLNESLGWAKNPLIDRLPNLHHTVPVTMLYGSNTWMDKQAGQQLKETLGNRASIHVVPRSGHHIYVDNHEFFNTTVIDRSLSILGQQS